MNRTEKAQDIEWLQQRFDSRSSVVFADFKGMTVEQVSVLRRECRKVNVEFRVVKNTLIRRAAQNKPWIKDVDSLLHGNTAVAFPAADAVQMAKTLADYAKTNEKFVIKGGVLSDKALSKKEVDALAKLPSREVLLAQLAGMLNQPMTRLATVLSAKTRELAVVIKQVEKKKQEAGAA